jgi:6-pyruvoyl-tetrahydropterin synthase
MSVTKTFTFDYAHRLMGTHGKLYDRNKCGSIHGHTGKIELTVERDFSIEEFETDEFYHDESFEFVMDYKFFKSIKEWIDLNFDHSCIISFNDEKLLEFCKSEGMKYHQIKIGCANSENMLKSFWSYVVNLLPDHVVIKSIKLYETPTSYAEYIPGE